MQIRDNNYNKVLFSFHIKKKQVGMRCEARSNCHFYLVKPLKHFNYG